MARFELSDAEWSVIAPLLPNKPRGVPRVDDRRVLNGIFYILRTGAPWRDLPDRYGPYTTIYNRYNRWAKAGVFVRIFEALSAHSPDSLHLIDSSIMRPPTRRRRKKGGPHHAIGRSRGGLSTKLHVVVDAHVLPVRLVLTPGQASDQSAVPALLAGLRPAADTVADKAYDAKALLELITQHGSRPHIPTLKTRRQQRTVDRELYRARNLVERFFNKLKHFRRIATRFDKLTRNFLAAVAIASASIWLRHNKPNESTA